MDVSREEEDMVKVPYSKVYYRGGKRDNIFLGIKVFSLVFVP